MIPVKDFVQQAGGRVTSVGTPPDRVDAEPKQSPLVTTLMGSGLPLVVHDFETPAESSVKIPKVAKYSGDQPRDEKGQFTSSGGNASHEEALSAHGYKYKGSVSPATGGRTARYMNGTGHSVQVHQRTGNWTHTSPAGSVVGIGHGAASLSDHLGAFHS